MSKDRRLEGDFYHGIEDFTFFVAADAADDGSVKQLDETVLLYSKHLDLTVKGRLNASSCFGRRAISCSFRATSEIPKTRKPYHIKYDIARSKFNPAPRRSQKGIVKRKSRTVPKRRYFSSVERLSDVIFKRIFASAESPRGLIVVAGATATGKSQVARGVIYKYLKTIIPPMGSLRRRPHLVTCEDPIDKLWASDWQEAKKTGVDYTPRELGADKDVNSLEEAITATLRQTPSVFFVGEIRSPDDWKPMLRFASTGHLAVTTSHAGSLTEAMGQILRAAEADTPALRSEIANRVMALVHLRTSRIRVRIDDEPVDLIVTIPAIWVRSAVSMKALMADGLAALLPYRDGNGWNSDRGRGGQFGCLGRSWFAEQLLRRTDEEVRSVAEDEIRSLAFTWDLDGV